MLWAIRVGCMSLPKTRQCSQMVRMKPSPWQLWESLGCWSLAKLWVFLKPEALSLGRNKGHSKKWAA